jgi:hypothetical protein
MTLLRKTGWNEAARIAESIVRMSVDAKLRQLLFELGMPPTSGPDTPIFIFSCAELKHIWIALQRRRWAVADIVSEQLKARITKARQIPLGASGPLLLFGRAVFYRPVPYSISPGIS